MHRRQSLPNIKEEETEVPGAQRPMKKRRVSDPPKPSSKTSKQAEEGASPSKAGKQVGSLIGRKRKERKMKKARGK